MIPWFFVAFVLLDLCVVFLVVGVILKNAWQQIAAPFPPQPIQETHYRRNFQSFSFGLMNAGFSFHVAIDDDHLHLIPIPPLRFIGLQSASIPWSQIKLAEKQPKFDYLVRAMIAGHKVAGPAWCFEMLKMN